MKIRFFLFAIAVFSIFLLQACSQTKPSRTEFVLGTYCTITLFDEGKDVVYKNVFRRLREIENLMSVHIKASDVYAVNNAAGIEAVKVNDEVFEVIEKAVRYAEMSGGAFDPTVGPLVSLWDITGDNPRVPSQDEIDLVLPLIDWRDIELDSANKTVFLKRQGMAIDLGGIAKGFAADEAAKVIKQSGVKRAIIDLGGNILTVGIKKDKAPWVIGIQDPYESQRGVSIGIVQVEEQSVVTSGVYERFFESEGVRYHHIFDPATGYPAGNGLMSVTVVADISVDADALSTSAFVLGYERGMALIETIEGVEAIFVFEDKSILMSRNAGFVLSDSEYKYGVYE